MVATETTPIETPEALIYDVAQRKASQQRDAIGAIDEKVGTLGTFSTALLAALGIIFPLASTHDAHSRVIWLGVLFAAVLSIYSWLLWLLYHAYRSAAWDWRPSLESLREHCDTHSLKDLQLWTAREYQQAIEDNRALLDAKGARLNFALLLVGAQAILIAAIGFIVFAWR